LLQNVNCSRSATMRRTKKQGTEKGRRLPGMREHGCWADGGLRWLGSPMAAVVMLLLLSCKDTVLMSSPSLFVSVFPLSVLFSLSMFFSFLLSLFLPYFFSLSFFFLSLFSLSSPISSTLSSPVFIGKKQGERGLLPLSSRGTGIGWPRQPPQGCPRGSSPLFFRLVVGHGSEFKQVMGLLSASF